MNSCGQCSDGYFVKDLPVGHVDYGRLFICECPLGMAIRRKRLERVLDQTGMPPEQRKMTFDNFDPKKGIPLAWPPPHNKSHEAERARMRLRALKNTAGGLAGNLLRAKTASHAYAKEPRHFFTLLGEPGCGKTHLAAAIANECMDRGFTVCFAVVPDLLDALRATFSADSHVSYQERFDAVLNVDLLVLDDIGTEKVTDWGGEKLYQIVNHRYNHDRPLVVTTNEVPAHLDMRLQSRLFDGRNDNVEILAGDFRPQRDLGALIEEIRYRPEVRV